MDSKHQLLEIYGQILNDKTAGEMLKVHQRVNNWWQADTSLTTNSIWYTEKGVKWIYCSNTWSYLDQNREVVQESIVTYHAQRKIKCFEPFDLHTDVPHVGCAEPLTSNRTIRSILFLSAGNWATRPAA